MQTIVRILLLSTLTFSMFSCIAKKKFASVQAELDMANKDLGKCGESLNEYMGKLTACEKEKNQLLNEVKNAESSTTLRQDQINDLKAQITDLQKQRDQQVSQVGDLTVLSKSANDNIAETLNQLSKKDKYIQLIQAAKTKADSINLALAVNLKGVLSQGLSDDDVEIKVDKTVVFINLSDKMLYTSGSAVLTPRAKEVLGKIAKIIDSRPDLEVMVEGHTDNVPITSVSIKDNWDLSVSRATAVVRVLQKDYNIAPNRLVAAGRSQYLPLADNSTSEGRSINRRTRIIILPKLDQFYDLLNPENVPN